MTRLLWLGCLTDDEAEATPAWGDWLAGLAREKRVARLDRAARNPLGSGRTAQAVPGRVAASGASSPRSRRLRIKPE